MNDTTKPVSAALATIFPNKHCRCVEKTLSTWPEVCAFLAAPMTEPVKNDGRLLSLAKFGTKTTTRGSLKHDENIVSVHGLLGDYDKGKMPISEARVLLEKAGVRALLYPSWGDALVAPPKYNGGPRWRVVAPFSKALSPAEHTRMMARLNGALGGVLAPESFTVAQGYFFGKRPGGTFECSITFNDPAGGGCVDELTALDAGAIGKAEKVTATEKKNDAVGERKRVDETLFSDLVDQLGRPLATGDDRRSLLASYVGLKSAQGIDRAGVKMMARGIAHEYFDHDDPVDWANIDALIDSTCDKDATKGLEDLIDQTKTAPERRYKPLGSAALAALPPLTWRVRGVLPAQGLAAIYGASGSGKSFLAIDLCAAIARGRSWFGKHATAAPVVYLCLEGEAGIRLRVQAWEKHNGGPLPDGLTFILQSFDMSSRQDLADLLAVLPAGGVVVIDTLNRAAPCVDENSSKDMGQVLTTAKTIQAHTAGLVVLIHHTGKDQTKGLRGHSSLHAALDAAIEVQRAPGWRSWSVAKAKDGEDVGSYTFDLKPVEVGQDEYGFAETSCVIAPAVVDAVAEPKLTGAQVLALAAFDAVDLGLGAVARDDWRREFYDRLGDRTPEAKRQAFTRSVAALVDGGVLSQTGDFFARASLF